MNNIAMWILAGGAVGWAAFAFFKANEQRGRMFSVVIGMFGGFFGGNVLAPMLGAITDRPNDFSPFSLAVALASATAWLVISDLLSRRFRT
ncbi:MAG TPA: GlsB/YeaQ/YmgE family stress response membrane protein [Burkholderiales bacterium]|nr:GlsB/YeaQ/YmgE family stress response membrane protein [Burkholderiales bacterium]